jgi:hypothetical protein
MKLVVYYFDCCPSSREFPHTFLKLDLVLSLDVTGSRDSSVGIAMGYWLGGWGSTFCRGKKFFSTAQHPDRLQVQPSFYPIGTGIFSSKVKRPGGKDDKSPQSSVEVKNGGATTPVPHTCS